MAIFGRDSGYDYGYRGNARYRYDQGFGRAEQSGYWGREQGFDRGIDRYGSEYRSAPGYDRNYKSRWQTDYGDPYGDRTSRTPMRVIRGEYEDRYGAGAGYGRDYSPNPTGYGRDYSPNPTGYQRYGALEGRGGAGGWGGRGGQQSWADRGRTGWGNRDFNRGYDREWF